MASKKFSHFVTKDVLHINPNERYRRQPKDLEKRAKEAIPHTYLEREPSVGEWLRHLVPTKAGAAQYMHDLFPSATWIGRYNFRWMFGDAVAGLTIGIVIIPQAMAYALLARLSPEFGLYTSFTGAVLYWLFGTSKDIVIGTTAVGSLLVGTVVTKVEDQRPGIYTHEEVAKALSVIAGAILLVLGICRLGWVIEFIPYVPISAFVTAASVTIMSTQLPVALGITGINTRQAPYRVLIETMRGLPRTKLDASIGLTVIALLFFIKYVCSTMEVRQPLKKRMWATLSSLRLTFAMIFFTFISWLVHRNVPKGTSKFRLVGVIQSGFKHAGVPTLNGDLVGMILPQLPAIVIILIIEHIAIAKSFGRVFGYTVITSQEMCAQGGANLFSPFVGGYVCTGSFSASAVLSKAGVRTPLAGLFSAFILILALYALTSVFYFIPMAALAGLIIHAVSNLATPPRTLYKYWQLSPFELLIWIVGVVLAIFTSLETSIYATIVLSFVLVLVRMARTKGRFLGRVRISRVIPEKAQDEDNEIYSNPNHEEKMTSRDVFLPIDRNDSSNPNVEVESPYPGVFIYQFSEGFNYINQGYQMDCLLSHILKNTRRTKSDDGISPKDRLWNDPGPIPGQESDRSLPLLRAVVLNCSAINNVDITSIQGLIDLRNTLDRHAAPATVEWHFAGVLNRWTRRSLAVSGFGYPAADSPDQLGNWTPVYVVASSPADAASDDEERGIWTDRPENVDDAMFKSTTVKGESRAKIKGDGKMDATRMESVHGVDRPFFHIDLMEAVDAALRDAKRKDARLAE